MGLLFEEMGSTVDPFEREKRDVPQNISFYLPVCVIGIAGKS